MNPPNKALGATLLSGDRCRFRVWSPYRERVGVRIGHAITRHALGEFNLDTSRGHMAISSSAPCWGWKPSKLGHEIPVKAHTSAMTTEECSTFIEWLPIWA